MHTQMLTLHSIDMGSRKKSPFVHAKLIRQSSTGYIALTFERGPITSPIYLAQPDVTK